MEVIQWLYEAIIGLFVRLLQFAFLGAILAWTVDWVVLWGWGVDLGYLGAFWAVLSVEFGVYAVLRLVILLVSIGQRKVA